MKAGIVQLTHLNEVEQNGFTFEACDSKEKFHDLNDLVKISANRKALVCSLNF